jgi:hypothetical protein
MILSLAAWLQEWATCDRKESWLGVFIETGQVRSNRSQSSNGKKIREHLFGSGRAPSCTLVSSAIEAAGGPDALAKLLRPIIDKGLNAQKGALTAALKEIAGR